MTTLEVMVFDGSTRVAAAEAETPEDAVFAGQTLYDEAMPQGVQTARKLDVGFFAGGKLVVMVKGRPEGRVLSTTGAASTVRSHA